MLTFELTGLVLVHAHVTIIALAQRWCFVRGGEKIMRYPSIYDVRFMALWGRLLDSSMARRSMGVQINSDFCLEIFSYSMRIELWSHAFPFYDFSLFGCFIKRVEKMPPHYPSGLDFLFLWIHGALISGIPLLINGNAG